MSSQTDSTGRIFNIERFAIHDGNGIRTLIFLKGCPLRCLWCSNPESQSLQPELFHSTRKCLGPGECGYCLRICPNGSIGYIDGHLLLNRNLCCCCGQCSRVCPAKAMELTGTEKTTAQLVEILLPDAPFYRRSGGGVTVSGGEPLSQAGFVADLFRKCHEMGMDTCLETCGYSSWENLNLVASHTDRILYDIKHLDDDAHQKGTGVPNRLILENLVLLSRRFPQIPVTVRTPVIPGFNCSVKEIGKIADFLSELPNVISYSLLPYHSFGQSKYEALGRVYPLDPDMRVQAPQFEELQKITNTIPRLK